MFYAYRINILSGSNVIGIVIVLVRPTFHITIHSLICFIPVPNNADISTSMRSSHLRRRQNVSARQLFEITRLEPGFHRYQREHRIWYYD